MKKIFYAAAAVAMMSMAACSNNNQKNEAVEEAAAEVSEQVYSGVLPAADAEGIQYILKLVYGEDGANGEYQLEETYLVTDSVSTKDAVGVDSKGTFTVENNNDNKYIKLVQDTTEAANAQPMFFLVASDSTITLVNAELQPAENTELNYTLTLVK